jgi:hypothetical protein
MDDESWEVSHFEAFQHEMSRFDAWTFFGINFSKNHKIQKAMSSFGDLGRFFETA